MNTLTRLTCCACLRTLATLCVVCLLSSFQNGDEQVAPVPYSPSLGLAACGALTASWALPGPLGMLAHIPGPKPVQPPSEGPPKLGDSPLELY